MNVIVESKPLRFPLPFKLRVAWEVLTAKKFAVWIRDWDNSDRAFVKGDTTEMNRAGAVILLAGKMESTADEAKQILNVHPLSSEGQQ